MSSAHVFHISFSFGLEKWRKIWRPRGVNEVDSAVLFILLLLFGFFFFLGRPQLDLKVCHFTVRLQQHPFSWFFLQLSIHFLGLWNVKFLLFVFLFYCQRAAHLQPSICHTPYHALRPPFWLYLNAPYALSWRVQGILQWCSFFALSRIHKHYNFNILLSKAEQLFLINQKFS